MGIIPQAEGGITVSTRRQTRLHRSHRSRRKCHMCVLHASTKEMQGHIQPASQENTDPFVPQFRSTAALGSPRSRRRSFEQNKVRITGRSMGQRAR